VRVGLCREETRLSDCKSFVHSALYDPQSSECDEYCQKGHSLPFHVLQIYKMNEADFYVQLSVFVVFVVFMRTILSSDFDDHRDLRYCSLFLMVSLMIADVVLQGLALHHASRAEPTIKFLLEGNCLDRSEEGINLDRKIVSLLENVNLNTILGWTQIVAAAVEWLCLVMVLIHLSKKEQERRNVWMSTICDFFAQGINVVVSAVEFWIISVEGRQDLEQIITSYSQLVRLEDAASKGWCVIENIQDVETYELPAVTPDQLETICLQGAGTPLRSFSAGFSVLMAIIVWLART